MYTRLAHLQLLMLAAGFTTPASATILTFDNMGLSDGQAITNYGSHVTGICTSSGQAGCFGLGNGFTPNIAVSYRTIGSAGNLVAANMNFWDFNYGDLVNITFMDHTTNIGEITFTPENGNSIRINSLDAAGWFQADRPNQTISILDSANTVLFSFSGTIHGAGPTHDHFNPNVSSTGPLRLQYSNDFNVGLDNINFDQVAPRTGVPEPSSAVLLGSVLAGLVVAKHARKAGRGWQQRQ